MFRRLGIDRLGFAGRMAAIVLLATFAALALGSAVQFMDGRDDPPRATPLAQRIAAIVTLLKQTNGSARETVLQAANSDDLSVRIADKEIADLKDGERLAGVEWVVREFLDEPDKHDVVCRFLFTHQGPSNCALLRSLFSVDAISLESLRPARCGPVCYV